MADEGKLNPAIVTQLYLEHGDQLRRFLLGLLRDVNLANDVLQATFAKAVEVGHTSREESRKAWLFRVAYNEAMALRRRDGVGQRVIEQLAWSEAAQTPRADDPLLKFETVEKVRHAIGQLDPQQQIIVQMRIYEEKKFATIAEELNIPLGTALGRMRMALAKLREKLAEHHRD